MVGDMGDNAPLFVRICNSHATNMSICNAIIGLQILILNAVELQIRQNEAVLTFVGLLAPWKGIKLLAQGNALGKMYTE